MSSIDKTSGAGLNRASEVKSDVDTFGTLLVGAKKLPVRPLDKKDENADFFDQLDELDKKTVFDPEAAVKKVSGVLKNFDVAKVEYLPDAQAKDIEVPPSPKLSKASIVEAESGKKAPRTRISRTTSKILEGVGKELAASKEPEKVRLPGRQVEGRVDKGNIGPAKAQALDYNPELEVGEVRAANVGLSMLLRIAPQDIPKQLKKMSPEQREEIRGALPLEAKPTSQREKHRIDAQVGVIKTHLMQSEITDKEKIAKKERFASLFSRSSEGSRLKKAGMWGGTGTHALIALGKTLEGIGTAGSKAKEGLKSFGSFVANGICAACKKVFVREPRYEQMTTTNISADL